MNHESKPGDVGAAAVCPACGVGLGDGAPGGLCSKCLLEGVAAPTEPATLRAGERPGIPEVGRLAAAFPELEIQGLIGAGGMGAVFKARQPHLDRWVALKVLPEGLASNPAFVERFNREARMLARLNHPNIVTVHDFGRREGFCYLLMEFVDGVNLRQAMRAGRFTSAQALELVPKICEALQFAHEEGVLHRDIKPENILLDGRGRVKIADFGIAKLMGEASVDATLTVSGAALGTPAYMAPEQIEHPSEVDHRADIYSLGVVLYELLTGELPLGRFAPPSEKTPLDARVDEIVMRALAKERERRQQSAAQVQTEVEGVTRSAGTIAAGSGVAVAGAATATKGGGGVAEPDFVLCHPRLPRMAQWITVYALLVFPVLWFLGLLWVEDSAKEATPYAQFLQHLQNLLTVVGELGVAGVLFVGGLKLRSLKVSGPRLIRGAIWAHFILGAAAIGLAILQEQLGTTSEAGELTPWEGLFAVGSLAAVVFEISALVWLNRNSHRLAVIFAEATPESEDAGAEVSMTAPPIGMARHATLGALVTALSVVFGLGVLGGGAMVVMAVIQDRAGQYGGLGPVEFAIALVGLLVVGGGGVVGGVLGWSTLKEIQLSGGRMGGVGRGLWAGLAWPLILLEAGMLVLAGWVFFRIGGASMLTMLLAILLTMGVAEWVVRVTWRWVRRIPAGQRVGRLPGAARALVVGSVLVVFAALFPAYSVSWANHLRSRIPEMVAVVHPQAGNEEPGTLEVEYPPRSIVWLSTAVYRDGVMQSEPQYTAHVVNGSLWEKVVAPLRFSGVPEGIGPVGSWKLEVISERHSVSFTASPDLVGGTRLAPVRHAEESRVEMGQSESIVVLSGQGVGGEVWDIRLKVSVEPLSPAYLFEGALAGHGKDWERTASNAVSMEETGR